MNSSQAILRRVSTPAIGVFVFAVLGCSSVSDGVNLQRAEASGSASSRLERSSSQTTQARPQSLPAQPAPRQTTAASFMIPHIPLPGDNPRNRNSRDYPYLELLDEATKPPQLYEGERLISRCTPDGNIQGLGMVGGSDLEATEVRRMLARGVAAATDWENLNFYRLRHELQGRVINRLAIDRKSLLVNQTPKFREQLEARERKTMQENRARELRGISVSNMTLQELQERHRANEVLIRQESSRVNRAAIGYHEELAGLTRSLFSATLESLNSPRELESLRAFAQRFDGGIGVCRNRLVNGDTSAIWRVLEADIEKVANQIIARNQSAVIDAIRAAGSRAALSESLLRTLGSTTFVSIAGAVPAVAIATSQQLERFDKEDALTRARAAAELVRLAGERRAINLRKAAQNAAPTAQEIAELYTEYLISNTKAAGTFGRLEKTSARSFDNFFTQGFLKDKKRGTTQVSIDEVKCEAAGKRQSCTYAELVTGTYFRLGLIEVYEDPIRSRGKAEFFWTAEGLQSPDLQSSIGALYYTTKSNALRSGSSAGTSSSEDYIADRTRDESNAREQRQQDARRAWESDQESRRQRNRSCGPAPNICN